MNSDFKKGKITLPTSAALLLGVIMLFLVFWSLIKTEKGSQIFWKTVASGQQHDEHKYYNWGYRVENYRLFKALRFSLYGSRGVKWTLNAAELSVINVVTEQWLQDDRAIYLDLVIEHADSGEITSHPAKLLFDFQRGELYVTSDITLGREWNWQGDGVSKNWRTDAEFNAILNSLR